MSDTWSRVRDALVDRAPASARCLRPPAIQAQVDAAQEELGLVFPQDLVDSALLVDGAEPDPRVGMLLPPMYIPVSLERMAHLWRSKTASAADVGGGAACGGAGSAIQGFSRFFVPVGDDTTGDLLVVDLRPGSMRGCVLEWGKVDGHFGSPAWGSLAEMWSDVAQALETGLHEGDRDGEESHLTNNGCAAVFTSSGAVRWEF
ncbi:SMI1/KNR4 family protein [Streptomyces sp. 372A]|uniref:SMI1/KNR4 family protein n=1 Tax=Streptomyces sp. SAS_281 TaxID=3412744 RepID=UPI00403C7E63